MRCLCIFASLRGTASAPKSRSWAPHAARRLSAVWRFSRLMAICRMLLISHLSRFNVP
jgi:hypothetical protein